VKYADGSSSFVVFWVFVLNLLIRVLVRGSSTKSYLHGVFYKFRCDNLDNKQIKFSSRRCFCLDLGSIRAEIQTLSKDIHTKILKSLDANKNSVKKNWGSVQELVCLQQKLLSLSATKYGIYDIRTTSLADNYLCSLAFRVYVVFALLKYLGFKTLKKGSVSLKWIKFLSYSNVFKHKVGSIKRVFPPKCKKSQGLLRIAIIADRLVQMLFVLTYEPIFEVGSDKYSFSFRRDQSVHQALGVLFSKLYDLYEKKRPFYLSRYVLNYDVSMFFEKGNCY
jgi:hypothetical protein